MLRKVGAIVAGVLAIVVLSVVTDTLLEKMGFYPPLSQGPLKQNLLAIALFYRTVYAFLGGYITAKLAPSNPKKYVMILLVIGTILGILGVVAGWNLSEHWYPVSLVVTSALAVWFGGKVGMKVKNRFGL